MKDALYYRNLTQEIWDNRQLKFWSKYQKRILDEIEKNARLGSTECFLDEENVFDDLESMSGHYSELSEVIDKLRSLGFDVEYKSYGTLSKYIVIEVSWG